MGQLLCHDVASNSDGCVSEEIAKSNNKEHQSVEIDLSLAFLGGECEDQQNAGI